MKALLVLWFSAWYSNLTVGQYVDDIEPLLRANRDNFLNGPHTAVRKAQALGSFDKEWNWLQSSQGCGSKLLGAAGKRCLNDRARDGQWPWEAYYRDPIDQAK